MKSIRKLIALSSILLLTGCGTSTVSTVTASSVAQSSQATSSAAASSQATASSNAVSSEVVSSSAEEVTSSQEEDKGYSIEFTYDEHVKIYVYETQDCSGTVDAYKTGDSVVSRNSDTGLPDSTGEGQVNFKLVFDEGYVIDGDPSVYPSGNDGFVGSGYKNIKNHASDADIAEGCYRVTKICHALCIDIHSKSEDVGEDYTGQYQIDFTHPDNVSVYIYPTQDYTADVTASDSGYARSDTGALDNSGQGQINFRVELPDGYEVDQITITGKYKNIKTNATDPDDIPENCYRVTKVASALTIDITIKETTTTGGDDQEETIDAYKVTFSHDEHTTIAVYPGKDYTVTPTVQDYAYGRDKTSGDYTKIEGQVNFLITFEDGYTIDTVTGDSTKYKNCEPVTLDDTTDTRIIYKVTKLTDDVTLTITSKAVTTD